MFYEARVHELRPVNNAEEAANLIKTGNVQGHQVLQWTSHNTILYCVPDGGINNPYFAVAMLRQEPDQTFVEISSITADWIDCPDRLAYALDQTATEPPFKKTQLILDEPKGHEIAWFSCASCGESFKGNIKEQLLYDHDAGLGCCSNCK